MLIFIENTPRAYAWGSHDALPKLLGTSPNGEPQAELWLGAHPGAPATVAKATTAPHTLIDLIDSDTERYGVDGGPLPFLLKVLAIGAPLSLQVHPNVQQARAGYAAEEAAGVPLNARHRNYTDPNHKPELLVALSEVTALSGFRSLAAARRDLLALAAARPAGPGREALECAAARCEPGVTAVDEARGAFMSWALAGSDEVRQVLAEIERAVRVPAVALEGLDAQRLACLRALTAAHPGDPGVLVSLLLHLVHLEPGEAIYLGAQQLHAYLSGIGVEIMAASDNVLRAGLTEKHVDVAELTRIVDLGELADPRLPARQAAPGLVVWQPPVPDFMLMRARLRDAGETEGAGELEAPLVPDDDRATRVIVEAPYPLVLIATAGRVRVERGSSDFDEVASVRRGQSLYISAGEAIELSGSGEAFLATVGASWAGAESATQPR